MSIASDHAVGFRKHWADRMVDTCTGVRLVGRGSINPSTYQYDSAGTSVVYDDGGGSPGPCLLRPAGGQADPQEFGQEEITRIDFFLFLPWDAGGIQPDDRFTMNTSVTDPEMVGKLLLVRGVRLDSYKTNMKLACELDLGPGEDL